MSSTTLHKQILQYILAPRLSHGVLEPAAAHSNHEMASSVCRYSATCFLLFYFLGDALAFNLNSAGTHCSGLRLRKLRPVSNKNTVFTTPIVTKQSYRSILPPLSVFFKNKWDDPDYDPTKQEIDTKVPLHLAAFKGDVEEVKRLLASGADVNEANDSGWTAIQWAARGAGKGQESPRAVEVCRLLKEAGADIMSINLTGNTALHHAAHWGDPAVTDLLISWYTPEQVS